MAVPHKLHDFLMDLRMAGYRVGEVESRSGRSFEITKNGNFVALVKGDKKGDKPQNNLLKRLTQIIDTDQLLAEYIKET